MDGQWQDLEVKEVTIMVKLIGPFMYPAKRRVLRSQHGPVIEGQHSSYALRYTGMNEVRQLEQYYRLDQAANRQEFMAAMAMNALPSINYVYADSDDNIAFIHNAQYPARDDNWDWDKDLPGDRSDLIWQGYRPFSEVPKLINPESGLLFNANNTPFSATDGSDNLSADDFPQSMGLATNQTNRSLRLIELNDGQRLLSKQAILQQKFDLVYSDQSEQWQTVKEIIEVDYSDNEGLAKAAKHLQKWNRSTDKENRHTALAILTLRRLSRSENPDNHSAPTLRSALSSTVEYLLTKHGRIDPPWGDVNRLIRGEINMPIDGGPDILRAIYSFGLDEDQPAYATHGDTWMALVEWDKEGQVSADVLHQFGSATLDKNSPHYSDQANMFAEKKWRSALLNISDIRANAERSYFPVSQD
jgi:penicillin amidase/acyl-homoserine-lactone acylase